MKIKTDSTSLLLLKEIGISSNNVKAIAGQSCKPTGRTGPNFTQVEFDGALIGWKEPFVFCVPDVALSR